MHNHDFYFQTQILREKQQLYDFTAKLKFARKRKISTALDSVFF